MEHGRGKVNFGWPAATGLRLPAGGPMLLLAMSDQPVYQATTLASAYDGIDRLPVVVFLDHVRSLYNVGSFFRTADAVRVTKLLLAGITASPPNAQIAKTALGAERTVPWERCDDPLGALESLRAAGCQLAAVETSLRAVDLFDWQPVFPVCILFGHEVDGISPELLERCDTHVRIPTLGLKQSLNVATSGGVALYELLRKYRRLIENGVRRNSE
jgi:23S rRNA (guanosine2251-2'-O)-methyltransferase